MTRVRISSGPPVTGRVMYKPLGAAPAYQVGSESADPWYFRCEDDVHQKPYPDGPLSIVKYTPMLPLTTWNTPVYSLDKCPVAWAGSDPSKLTSEALVNFKNRVLSASGPLTPSIYAPTALFELRDVPRMLRHAGDLLHKIKYRPSGLSPAKEAASATLAYQFGWAPIVQDLVKLTGLAGAVRQRQKNLSKAGSPGGLKRRISLGSDTKTVSGTTTVHSTYGINIQPKFVDTMSYKQWATIRWTIIDASQLGKDPSWMDATYTELGFLPGHVPIEIWKAIPWTWMIDWFADISNILAANYNSIFYRPSLLNIMRHSVSERQFMPYQQFAGGIKHVEWKERYVDAAPSASLRLRVPFLDPFKLSILGSLTYLNAEKLSRRKW